MKRNEFSFVNFQILPSVQNKADVAIGQGFYLNILIKSNQPIPKGIQVTLEQCVGLTVESFTQSSPTPKNQNTIHVVAYVVVDSSGAVTEGDKVSYTVNVSGSYKKGFYYIARSVNEGDIRVQVNKAFCYTPEGDENLDMIKDNFISYSAKLFNATGQPMQNTPIQIYSVIGEDIKDKVTITNDPESGQLLQAVEPVIMGNNVFIPVSSDSDGEIKFRVYPKKDISAEIELGVELSGLNVNFIVPSIYIISHKPSDPNKLLPRPIIVDLNDGRLSAYGSNQTFEVKIPHYNNALDGDSVLFFIKDDNDVFVPPAEKIKEPYSSNYSFFLYYDIFQINKPSELYYVISPEEGYSLYSKPQNVTYTGGGDNRPSDKIQRVLDKPIVYSSWANPKSRPPLNEDSDFAILSETYYVNSMDIEGYTKNGGYGLFIKLVGTSDITDRQKPKFGDKIHFTMYLNGGLYVSEQIAEKDVQRVKRVSSVISHVPDHHDGNTSTTVIYIEHAPLANLSHSSNGGSAMIYFEYYVVSDEGERVYSNYWKSKIETIGD